MKCEVRNVESQEVHPIPPEGMIFGRAGGPAGITVSDQAVSKRHARIFLDEGVWYLEDMNSVNGTVVNNRRITERLALNPGVVFSLSKHRFEVVTVGGASSSSGARGRSGGATGGESDPRRSARGDGASNAASGGESDPRRAARSGGAQAGGREGGSASSRGPAPDAEPMSTAELSGSRSVGVESSLDARAARADDGEAAGAGVAGVLAALPRAIAHFSVAIPMLMVAARAAVRRGTELLPLRAMGPLELVAFSLPVQLLAGVLVPVAGSVGALLAGGTFSPGALVPAAGLVVAVVGAVVAGFLGHPVTTFFIDKLFRGRSDDITRTNAIVMMQAAYGVVMVPAALEAALAPVAASASSSTPAAALLLLGPALAAAILLPVPAYVAWKWMERFEVADAVRTAFKVLFFLAIIGAVASAATTCIRVVNAFIAAPAAAAPPDQPAGDAAAGTGVAKDQPVTVNGAAPSASAAQGEPAREARDAPAPEQPAAAREPPPATDLKSAGTAAEPSPAAAREAASAAVESSRSSPYADYKEKLAFVEAAIASNPAILMDDVRVAVLYKELSRQKVAAIEEADGDIPKQERADMKFFLERYREAHIFKRTQKTVDQLHRLLRP